MSALNKAWQGWRRYVSPRLWILAALLLVLCALAVLQHRWIEQVSRAERERSKSILSTALSDLESDFDIEITRVVTTFELPAANSGEYAERYSEWLRRSPTRDHQGGFSDAGGRSSQAVVPDAASAARGIACSFSRQEFV